KGSATEENFSRRSTLNSNASQPFGNCMMITNTMKRDPSRDLYQQLFPQLLQSLQTTPAQENVRATGTHSPPLDQTRSPHRLSIHVAHLLHSSPPGKVAHP